MENSATLPKPLDDLSRSSPYPLQQSDPEMCSSVLLPSPGVVSPFHYGFEVSETDDDSNCNDWIIECGTDECSTITFHVRIRNALIRCGLSGNESAQYPWEVRGQSGDFCGEGPG
jgi:hypothetical protein